MISARRARGYILLPVAIAIALIAAIAYISTRESSIEVNRSASEFENEQLEYLLQAGMQHALYAANQGNCSGYALPATAFGAHSYEASFSPDYGSPVSMEVDATLASGPSRDLTREQLPVHQAPVITVLQPGAGGKDTYLSSFGSRVDSSYGGEPVIIVTESSAKHGLLEFDLSAIPPTAQVTSATLEIFREFGGSDGSILSVHRLTQSWLEGTTSAPAVSTDGATWNKYDAVNNWTSPGGDFDPLPASQVTINSAASWHSLDLSGLVSGWVKGTYPNYGVLLLPGSGFASIEFSSSDHATAGQHPKLTIEYACECGAGTASSLVLQPGSEGKETVLLAGSKSDRNAGSGKQIYIGNGGSPYHGLFEFDLGDIPANAIINQATLKLYDGGADSASADAVIGLFRATTAWTEGSGAQTGTLPADGASWDAYDGVNSWSTPGGDYDPLLIDSVPATVASSLMEFDVTSLVGGWVNGTYPNYGFMLKAIGGSLTKSHLVSGDELVATNHPRLEIDYVCPCGAVCVAPGALPPGNLLFVVGDVGGPGMTAEEIAHQALIESWGYSVQVIDEDDSQSEFDAAVAINDLVFLTNDVTSSNVNTKLVNATIGVVTSEDNLSDEFGLSDGIAWDTETSLEINDNSHYITTPFAIGPLTIFSASDSLAYLTPNLAPDLRKLASTSSGFGLVALEAGATTTGAGSAAGRRVQLPWGGGGFSLANLNAAGRDILKRALEWGQGAPNPLGPVAHWRFDDGGGVTAIDSVGGHDGSLINEPSWATGRIDGALDFDGVDDYVDAGQFDIVGDGITMIAWIKPDGLLDQQIVSKSQTASSSNSWWRLGISVSGGQRFVSADIKAGGVVTSLVDSSVDLLDGQWYYVAATYDNASGMMRLYVDAVEVASLAHASGGALDTDASIAVNLGASKVGAGEFGGSIDDLRLYNQALDAAEITALYDAAPAFGTPGYNELNEPIFASSNNNWQPVDLDVYGVPGNAVVEVLVINVRKDRERWGGVRAIGSTLERRLQLHEAESVGEDAVTMHVQAEANGAIEIYSEVKSDIVFRLIGYWNLGSYVEAFDAFSATASGSWVNHSLLAAGVPPGAVSELAISNSNAGSPRSAGLRLPGSSNERRLTLQEAENGGVDAVSAWVESDALSSVELYAESSSDIGFHLLGYWSSAPGVYHESTLVIPGEPAAATWESVDLSGLGVPANAVAQIVSANAAVATASFMGVRQVGSFYSRTIDLHEAEGGGNDLATQQVNVDGAATIERYDEQGSAGQSFYLVGWWVLSP